MSWKISPVKSGQTIGLWTPASSVKPEQVQNGLAQLKARGFNYRLGAHAFSHNGITAASPASRLSDLHGFLRDPQISAIWALRGGYGTAQMLNQIDYDLLQKHPKLLIGFSDVTALEWGIFAQTGMPTFSGLTITTQFSDENPYLDTALRMLSGEKNAIDESDLPQGTPVIHRKGSAEGLLIGGTLSMICSLYGTPYFPESENLILFIEDVDEPLYRIDRLLWQLHLGGFWERVSAVILGKFVLGEQFLEVFDQLEPMLPDGIPVVSGFPYGHFTPCLPLPVGVPASFDASPFRLEWQPFLQSVIA